MKLIQNDFQKNKNKKQIFKVLFLFCQKDFY